MRDKALPCLLCGSDERDICYEGIQGTWVTSDCKPWIGPVVTIVCKRCAHVQKSATKVFEHQVAEIYTKYDLYQLSGGSEQLVFQNGAGQPKGRSAKIIEWLDTAVKIPQAGSLLDVGCGNGATLRAFGERYPDWNLFGHEQNARYREVVLDLPGVAEFYCDSLDSIDQRFDLISMIHVLEHVSSPARVLRRLQALLKPDGLLLVQVPDILQNPFDMLVVDHYSHFCPQILSDFVTSLGYELVSDSMQCIDKEITLIARQGSVDAAAPFFGIRATPLTEQFQRSADWLSRVAQAALEHAGKSLFGIFGTAIAGTWLRAVVGDQVQFFVDEDVKRVGKLYLDRPVLHPRQLTENHCVFLAFPYAIAARIRKRLSGSSSANYLLPPA